MAIWLERMDDMTSRAGRQAAEDGRGGLPPCKRKCNICFDLQTCQKEKKNKQKRQKKKSKKRRKILEHISRLMPLSRVPVLPVLSGIIIIIFVISNLQHAHGISPASRSQKGSLSRSDNCPEQLLSTRPRQDPTELSLGTIFISRLIYSQNTFPFATVASARTSLGLNCVPHAQRYSKFITIDIVPNA